MVVSSSSLCIYSLLTMIVAAVLHETVFIQLWGTRDCCPTDGWTLQINSQSAAEVSWMKPQCSCHSKPFLKKTFSWLEVAHTRAQIDTAAENPQKQHRGRGAQELSTRFARVELIISPNVPVYCHLLLWQRAVWLCCWGDLLSPRQWLFVFVLLRAQKCNRHAANQATAALWAGEWLMPSCARGHRSRRAGGLGLEWKTRRSWLHDTWREGTVAYTAHRCACTEISQRQISRPAPVEVFSLFIPAALRLPGWRDLMSVCTFWALKPRGEDLPIQVASVYAPD